ncbi:hypothetical protein GCM10007079_05990 [Nocardiopsis terrae]|uniref:WXG100 family type VII secretion target n=1 Tax=Nocardiopsis terrae TaxID=372655 RepID=A0ABR9HNN8_9ACTN|nr:hypothetical protein [Nocardiopsis terrae]MBE1460647.1 hypothetical protein [Nocardiopsis terrae]GHC72636.1 hypothetical protein GCM10007079_05990 [Nocardiopsis terrae]
MSERVAYDPAVSAEVQSTLNQVTSKVESLIDQRGIDVGTAMSEIEAGEATTLYTEKEQKWAEAAMEVRGIIKAVERTLVEYDNIAAETMTNASNAVQAI